MAGTTAYPTSVDAYGNETDNVDTISAEHINDLRRAVEALETALTPDADGLVINETHANKDFRVEGDTDANLLKVDAALDFVGIGTAVPTVKLDVTGAIKASTTAAVGTALTVGTSISQTTNVIRTVIKKTNITDNSATNLFTITTTNETGSTDGGVYSVKLHGVVAHGSASDSAETSCKSFGAQFCRATNAAGAAGNVSAVTENLETASAASTTATKDLTTVTLTLVETSEYVITAQILVDCTGSTVTTADVTFVVELVYIGFLTAPVIAAA